VSEVAIHGFAGIKNPGQEAIHAPVRGEASMSARIEHLMTCIKVKDDEIETLKLQLQTVQMNRELESKDFTNQVHSLAKAQETITRLAQSRGHLGEFHPPAKKKSWKFWKK
jgi:hypothetical protein